MITVTPAIQLNDEEIELAFIRSPGPGGQNVNKVSSAVQLRFDVHGSPTLPMEVKKRLMSLSGKHITVDGVLIIQSRQYRTQERNRQAAIDRLVRLIQKASKIPKARHKTRPSSASILRRLETKHKRSEIKRLRRDRHNVE